MLLSANEVSAELLTGRGGGDDAAPPSCSLPPLTQQPSPPTPPLPPSSEGGDYYDVDVVDPLSELFFSLCVPSAKSGRVLPSSLFHPTHMHTHFFSFL